MMCGLIACGSEPVERVDDTGADQVRAPEPVPDGSVALTVLSAPEDAGTVTVTPEGPYVVGDIVTLTALADYGFELTGWQGVVATAPTVTFELKEDMTVIANFARVGVTVSLTASPVNGATFIVSPEGPHHVGDIVTITANVVAGYQFDHWSDEATESTRTLTLDDDVALVAELVAVPVISGADTHVGNDTDFLLTWTYAARRGDTVSDYELEEAISDTPFVVLDVPSDNGVFAIPIIRAPHKQCYRMRVRVSGAYSPYSNTHCMQRVAGPKQVKVINDLPRWAPGYYDRNGIVIFRLSATSAGLASAPDVIPRLRVIPSEGGELIIPTADLPRNYWMAFDIGFWDPLVERIAITTGCNGEITTKSRILTASHTDDTRIVRMSELVPDYHYLNDGVRDPLFCPPQS